MNRRSFLTAVAAAGTLALGRSLSAATIAAPRKRYGLVLPHAIPPELQPIAITLDGRWVDPCIVYEADDREGWVVLAKHERLPHGGVKLLTRPDPVTGDEVRAERRVYGLVRFSRRFE